MITEKLMMPYVLGSQHKIFHITMMFSLLIVYFLLDDQMDSHYYKIKFIQLFHFSFISEDVQVMKAFWLMFLVHLICFVLDFLLDWQRFKKEPDALRGQGINQSAA